MRTAFRLLALGMAFLLYQPLPAQKTAKARNLIYVDKQGVIRFTKDKQEAAFFGVNYTMPFAHAYRACQALNLDPEDVIRQDVYHFSRLGLDAFRLHVWDTEISDTLGNLLENEHLRLFDFLLAELKKRNIKTIITPIAFWGNGYPERDEATPGFSRKYGKGRATTNDSAIAAQENYLRHFFRHVNPYTKLTYVNDPDVIAVELNNEPAHSGSKQAVTNYINRLADAVKGEGWTKPVFYNIAQNPFYADAVAKAGIDGVSFQWYPTGLVAGYEQQGNFLPGVDRYTIPFDSVPEYRRKARMVYEFDAADLLQSCMYPAMARSFREAGMQWVTQFAYDPVALAYANTEYQTHYLNLAYTPSKAISLLIASKAFHRLPRLTHAGSYPADSVFDVFRVSYRNNLSEMNSEEEFYYSNTTTTRPKDAARLRHIAGVGNSPLVQYAGTGAYFLDKIHDDMWRLEVMPDVVAIRDPFEKASLRKEVTRVEWRQNKMHLFLPGLAKNFLVRPFNEGNSTVKINGANYDGTDGFYISPGTYVIEDLKEPFDWLMKRREEFSAPRPFSTDLFLSHSPYTEVTAGRPVSITAKIAGVMNSDSMLLEFRNGSRWRAVPVQKQRAGEYIAEIPAEAVVPGMLHYRIVIRRAGKEWHVFPGNHIGDPYAWDNTNTATWQTIIAPAESGLEIYNTGSDRERLTLYSPDWRDNMFRFIPAARTSELATCITSELLADQKAAGWQFYFGHKIKGRESELSSFSRVVVKARADMPVTAKLILITKDALCFSAGIRAGADWSEIKIPVSAFQPDSCLLLPRPYPGFLPLWFKPAATGSFHFADAEKMQVVVFGEGKPVSLDIVAAWLEK